MDIDICVSWPTVLHLSLQIAPQNQLTSKQASKHPCTAYVQVNAAHDVQTDHCLGGICPLVLNGNSMGTVDWQVLGSAMVKPLGPGCDSELVSELAAFCVHPDYRGSGRGDSLLAYLGDLRLTVLLHTLSPCHAVAHS